MAGQFRHGGSHGGAGDSEWPGRLRAYPSQQTTFQPHMQHWPSHLQASQQQYAGYNSLPSELYGQATLGPSHILSQESQYGQSSQVYRKPGNAFASNTSWRSGVGPDQHLPWQQASQHDAERTTQIQSDAGLEEVSLQRQSHPYYQHQAAPRDTQQAQSAWPDSEQTGEARRQSYGNHATVGSANTQHGDFNEQQWASRQGHTSPQTNSTEAPKQQPRSTAGHKRKRSVEGSRSSDGAIGSFTRAPQLASDRSGPHSSGQHPRPVTLDPRGFSDNSPIDAHVSADISVRSDQEQVVGGSKQHWRATASGSQGLDGGQPNGDDTEQQRTLESIDRPGPDPTTATIERGGDGLLTAQQIEALQHGNDDPQDSPAAQSDNADSSRPRSGPPENVPPRIQYPEERRMPQNSRPGGGNDRSNRGKWKISSDPELEIGRRMMSIPGVLGSYVHFSNKLLKYTAIPDDVDTIRQKLFKFEKPIFLTSQQIADYWPHMTNVWVRLIRQADHSNGVSEENWECRLRRRVNSRHDQAGRGRGTRHRQSKRQMLEIAEACPMRICLTYYTKHADTDEDHKAGFGACKCVPDWLYIRKTEKCEDSDHNHEIDMLDKFKRSDAMMFLVKKKAEEGHLFSSVIQWLHKHYDGVTKQAHFMSKQEVSNVAQAWRTTHRDVELMPVEDEPTPEAIRALNYVNLLHTARPRALIRALAAASERIPEIIDITTPLIEALQIEGGLPGTERKPIDEGDDINIDPVDLPKKWRAPTPPVPQRIEVPAHLLPEDDSDLRWRQPAVGQPSPLPPPQSGPRDLRWREPVVGQQSPLPPPQPQRQAKSCLPPPAPRVDGQPPSLAPRPPAPHLPMAPRPPPYFLQHSRPSGSSRPSFQPPPAPQTTVYPLLSETQLSIGPPLPLQPSSAPTYGAHDEGRPRGPSPGQRAPALGGLPYQVPSGPSLMSEGGGVQGSFDWSRRSEDWRPSWLKPIGLEAAPQPPKGKEPSAEEVVARQLEIELGARRPRSRIDRHDPC